MDWLGCRVVEVVPGKLSGAPLIRGSRVRPEDVLNNLDLPPEEIATEFGLSLDDVREVLAFVRTHEGELLTEP